MMKKGERGEVLKHGLRGKNRQKGRVQGKPTRLESDKENAALRKSSIRGRPMFHLQKQAPSVHRLKKIWSLLLAIKGQEGAVNPRKRGTDREGSFS